jgi:hypothetical protein
MLKPIFWSDKIKGLPSGKFNSLFQLMANRLTVGHVRYPNGSKFITRLKEELKVYQKKGNAEQLLNIANYALLEYLKPEHKNFHHDNKVDSVTRGKI